MNSISKNSVMSRHFDIFLFVLTIAVSIFGVISIYTATRTLGTNTNVVVQSCALVLGTVLMLCLCFFDYEQFKNMSKFIYAFALFILILVLVIGTTGGWGARSWIRFGPIGIQPSEIAKICFLLTFSYHLSSVTDKVNKPLTLLGLIVHIGVLLALIMCQPDAGSAMVFMFMFALMLFSAKLSYKYIIPVITLGLASLPFIYKFALSPFQQMRIQVFFNPELSPLDEGYSVIQSKIAVGSGGIFGKGFLHGTQNQMGYLTTKYTDFIYSVVAEEFGFIGAVLVILALFLIIFKCFKIASKSDNLFGRYICVGAGAMLLFHTFENAGMCIGLMPVTGIPLPFMSYGGTSLLTNMAAIGLVMSVAYHNKPRTIYDVY